MTDALNAPASLAAAPSSAPRYYGGSLGNDPANTTINVDGVCYEQWSAPGNPGPNAAAVHPWERAGLGVAPYKLVGTANVSFRACMGAPVQPGGTCDFCGQGLRLVFSIRASCGSTFRVGCDCVRRVCSPAEGVLTQVEASERKHKRKIAAAGRARRAASVEERLKEIRAEHESELAALPHPKAADATSERDCAYWGSKTALDYLDYMLRVCGAQGRKELLRRVSALLGIE